MSLPFIDARPAGFQVRWPASGDVTILLRAPEDALADTDLDVWVQSKSLATPTFTSGERTLTATVGTVEQVTVDGTVYDQASVTFANVDELEQGTWYRLFVADGTTVWCNGLIMGDNSGADAQSTVLDVTLGSLTLDLSLTVLAGGGGGAPTGGAGGFLSGTYPNPGVNTEALQDAVGAMAGTGLTYDDATGRLSTPAPLPVAVRTVPAIAEFGGSISGSTLTIESFGFLPAGSLVWTVGNGGRWWSHVADGVFTETTSPATMANFLSGRPIVVSFDYATSDPADGLLSVWHVGLPDGVTPTLTRTSFIPTRDLAEVDDRLDAIEADVAELDALAVPSLVRPEPTQVFRHDGTNSGDWHTPHVGSFTGGYDYRACVRPLLPPGTGEWYSECGTQTRDSLVGVIDNHETAILRGDNSQNVNLTTDRAYLFFELTRNGATSEVPTRLISDLHTEWGEWVVVRVTVNFATTTVRHWVQVREEFSEAETFDTTADGRIWWLIGELVNSGYDSIDPAITEPWQIGHNFFGDTAWHEWYSGIDGTRIAAPSAMDGDPGDTAVTCAEGRVWTAQSTARLVAPQAPPATPTVDHVSNVATARILGRTTAGSGNSEELTAAQARDLLSIGLRRITDQTLGSDTASVSVDVTGLTIVQILVAGRSTRASAQDTFRLTFNANTGNVYSTDSGALTSSLTLAAMPGALTNADRVGYCRADLHLLSGVLKAGTCVATNIGSTASVGQSVVNRGLFSTITAAVTSLELSMVNANIAAGSRIIVLGA